MSAVTLFLVVLLAPAVHGLKTYDTGSGIVYKLGMEQDVTLERGSSNFNYLEYLIVSKHPGYPNKRSLVQFEDLPSTCPTPQIESAKMYLYYEYAHKASGSSISRVPFIPRYLEVYLVRNPWNEAQTTSTMRLTGTPWSSQWLGLDGTDAEATPQLGTVVIFPYRPKGFIEFDVTNAVRSWSDGVANNGLVIRATNELDPGRDIRFASHAMSDSSKHAFVLVRCIKEGEYHISSAPSSRPHYHHSIYTIPYQNYAISEEKLLSSTPSSMTPYHSSTLNSSPLSITPYHHTSNYTTPYHKFTVREEKTWSTSSTTSKHLSVATPCCKDDDDEPNKQVQKHGSGWSDHKRSSMVFFSVFLVRIVLALA